MRNPKTINDIPEALWVAEKGGTLTTYFSPESLAGTVLNGYLTYLDMTQPDPRGKLLGSLIVLVQQDKPRQDVTDLAFSYYTKWKAAEKSFYKNQSNWTNRALTAEAQKGIKKLNATIKKQLVDELTALL